MTGDNSGWTLGTVWAAIVKSWYVIVAAAVVGAVAGFALASAESPVFQARTTLYVSINQGSSGSDLNQGTTYAQNQMQSFALLATSSRVLEPVIDELGLDLTPRDLARNIQVVTPRDTLVITIQASSGSPTNAARIADAVGARLATAIGEVSPASADGAPTIEASVIDDAVVPSFQVSPNKPRDTLLGGAIGFIVGIALALLRAMLDTRIPTITMLCRVTASPVLGSITRVRGPIGLVALTEPAGRVAEDFRRIHSALSYAGVSHPLTVMLVTSTAQSEGKSSFSTNFALTASSLGERVLLIDADLRRPRIAELTGIEGAVGLTDVLVGDVSFDEAKVAWRGESHDVLPSGSLPPNPAEMLTSDAMRQLVESVRERYDYVVVDAPPVQSVADANLLAPLVDGAVVVVDATRTRRSQLSAAVASFEAAGGRIVGLVLNKVRRPRATDNYYTQDGRSARSGTRK